MDENHKLTNYCKKLIAVILIASIIATSFSSVVQISAQIEGKASQSFQLNTSENISVQTSARPDEPTEEIVVSNENDFAEFMTKPEHWEIDVKVTLACDIDMKGKAFNPIKEFSGVFDGCGHTISNLKIQNKSDKGKKVELAFINTLNEFAEIKNVTFENYIINGESNVKKAGFILENHGIISNVDIKDGSINNINKNAKVAEFVVKNSGSITKSSAEMSLDKGGLVGGFVIENDGNIEKSSFKGNIESKICSGGFCSSNSGKIDSCKSEGNVIAKTKSQDDVTICGGFVGENSGFVRNSSSTGTVNGQEYVGGFVGVNNAEISSCNAYVKATAKTKTHTACAGGFVGENEKGTIINCTATGGVDSRSSSGQAKAGGFVGINKASIIGSKASGYVYLSEGTFKKDDSCGGFVGQNDKGGKIDGCYAECTVETTFKNKGGGFVGEAKNKSTIMSSWCKAKIITKSGVRNQTKFY